MMIYDDQPVELPIFTKKRWNQCAPWNPTWNPGQNDDIQCPISDRERLAGNFICLVSPWLWGTLPMFGINWHLRSHGRWVVCYQLRRKRNLFSSCQGGLVDYWIQSVMFFFVFRGWWQRCVSLFSGLDWNHILQIVMTPKCSMYGIVDLIVTIFSYIYPRISWNGRLFHTWHMGRVLAQHAARPGWCPCSGCWSSSSGWVLLRGARVDMTFNGLVYWKCCRKTGRPHI